MTERAGHAMGVAPPARLGVAIRFRRLERLRNVLELKMPKIDVTRIAAREGGSYPAPFDQPCRDRKRWLLGEDAGLTQFGVNLLRMPPGTWSSQRHWHTAEDEFVWGVMTLDVRLTLKTTDGALIFMAYGGRWITPPELRAEMADPATRY